MLKVTAYHNETCRFEEYRVGDQLKAVMTLTIDASPSANDDEEMELLDHVYREFNVGDGLAAWLYREGGNRSLSVGDVVAINDRHYACARAGWTEITWAG